MLIVPISSGGRMVLTLREFEGIRPKVSESAYIDSSAMLIGDVHVGERSGIFPNAVIRADESTIEIGRSSFVLDLALIEAPSGCPVSIGDGSIISHGAMIHGGIIGDNSLVGIGAIILERANIGDDCIIAAGSLIPPNARINPKSVLMGIPAKVAREATDEDLSKLRSEINHLKTKTSRFRKSSK